MRKKEVLTMSRANWEAIRQAPEKAQIKDRYNHLLDLLEDCFDED